jgi:hypothetical protein
MGTFDDQRVLFMIARRARQFRMMEYMRDFLPDTMVIHAGHRPGLERFLDGDIQLVREKREGPTTTQEHHFSPLELVSRALERLGRGRSA